MLSGICVAIFFRVFVRQTTGVTPVVTTAFYDLQGNQISSQQKQPSSSDLAKSDWYWLQWNQASSSSAYKLRITLGSKSSLAGSQEVHYDKVCASIASAPTGKILASPIHIIFYFLQNHGNFRLLLLTIMSHWSKKRPCSRFLNSQ